MSELPILDRSEPIKLPSHLQDRLESEQARFGKGDQTKHDLDRELEEANERKRAEDQARAEKARAMAEGEPIESVDKPDIAAKQHEIEAQLDELRSLNAKLAETEQRQKSLVASLRSPSDNPPLSTDSS